MGPLQNAAPRGATRIAALLRKRFLAYLSEFQPRFMSGGTEVAQVSGMLARFALGPMNRFIAASNPRGADLLHTATNCPFALRRKVAASESQSLPLAAYTWPDQGWLTA